MTIEELNNEEKYGEKSHVSLSVKLDRMTGKPFEDGSILLAKEYTADGEPVHPMNKHTVVGWGDNEESQQKFKEGYCGVIVIDKDQSDLNSKDVLSGIYRTGDTFWIRKAAFKELFHEEGPIGLMDKADFEQLKKNLK